MKRNGVQIEHLIFRFLTGDIGWANLRFAVILLTWALWAALINAVFDSKVMGLRYLVLPVGIIVFVILLGARYVQDVYNLKSYQAAFRYMVASFFGIGYPKIKIEHGKKEQDSDVLGLMETIGGPGFMDVLPGNVVLLERLENPSAVCGSGLHFLPRFDRIGAIVDLEEQQHNIKMLEATTKDGIRVIVRNIYYHYRLMSPPNRARTVSDPYPYSVQAVKNLAYGRSVDKDGNVTPWENAVKAAVNGAIADYISEHQIDHITSPAQLESDPRAEIARRLKSPEVQNRLKAVGTVLTWFDIGSINAADGQVDLQRIKKWQANWNGQSTVVRAQGEAQRIAYQEVGRVETQSELLRGILSSFRNIRVSDDHKENIRKIVMARTAQLLDAMSSLYRNEDGELLGGTQEVKSPGRVEQSSEDGNNSEEET